MRVKLKLLHPLAEIPQYSTDGSGCFDIKTISSDRVISRGEAHIFETGLAIKVPKGHVLLLFSRSGHGFNEGLRLGNCVGVIDSDYTGEIKVKLQSDALFGASMIRRGDRIAQGLILPIEHIEFEQYDELEETERGSNGFGSTGR